MPYTWQSASYGKIIQCTQRKTVRTDQENKYYMYFYILSLRKTRSYVLGLSVSWMDGLTWNPVCLDTKMECTRNPPSWVCHLRSHQKSNHCTKKSAHMFQRESRWVSAGVDCLLQFKLFNTLMCPGSDRCSYVVFSVFMASPHVYTGGVWKIQICNSL